MNSIPYWLSDTGAMRNRKRYPETDAHWRDGLCWCDEQHRTQATILNLIAEPPLVGT